MAADAVLTEAGIFPGSVGAGFSRQMTEELDVVIARFGYTHTHIHTYIHTYICMTTSC